MRMVLVGGLLLGLLCACDRPRWARHEPGSAPTAADMAGVVSEPAYPTKSEPMPALEPWAVGLIGKPVRAAFPKDDACNGNADLITMKYAGAVPGTRVIGWGWNLGARRAVARVVLADEAGLVVGAGSGGLPRPDVRAALPDVTSDATGWQALTSRVSGRVMAFGVSDDGTAICTLGQIEL